MTQPVPDWADKLLKDLEASNAIWCVSAAGGKVVALKSAAMPTSVEELREDLNQLGDDGSRTAWEEDSSGFQAGRAWLAYHQWSGGKWIYLVSSVDVERAKAHKTNESLTPGSAAKNWRTSESNRWQDSAAGGSDDLKSTQEQLDELIGLSEVKAEVRRIAAAEKIAKIRRERDMTVPQTSRHLVFTGSPGTGKTTVARIFGRILAENGVLSSGHVIEASRGDLVAGYLGQTALKTEALVKEALNGVLFIDEAYTLSSGSKLFDYGVEAIETLLKMMEDHRENLVVIVAGYQRPMEEFLEANPGLRSRFDLTIPFFNPSESELEMILKSTVKDAGLCLTDDATEKAMNVLNEQRHEPGWANARSVRKLIQRAVAEQAVRLSALDGTEISDDLLVTIEADDISGAEEEPWSR